MGFSVLTRPSPALPAVATWGGWALGMLCSEFSRFCDQNLTNGLKEQRLLQLFFSQDLCVVAWTNRLEQSIMGIEKMLNPSDLLPANFHLLSKNNNKIIFVQFVGVEVRGHF